MSTDNQVGVEEVEIDDDGIELPEKDLESDVTDRVNALEYQQKLNGLLADPEIQAVLAARQSGKKIKIASVEDEIEKVIPPELLDGLEDDDPTRKILEKLDGVLNQRLQDVLEPLNNRLQRAEAVAEQVRQAELTTQVNSAASKYKDLSKYHGDMVSLAKQTPGLSVEELYLIAKNRKGKLQIAPDVTPLERPTSQPGARRKTAEAPKIIHGRKGFDQMLSQALDKLNLNED